MRNLKNKAILLGICASISGLTISPGANADGLTAAGASLPIGTSSGTVLTITGGGTSGDASFAGTLETDGRASVNSLAVTNSGSFGGSVGIGTTAPQYPLDVQMGESTPIVAMRAKDNVDLMWFRNGSSYKADGYAWDISNRGVAQAATDGVPTDTLFLYRDGGANGTKDVAQSWQQNGNVGIGTPTPSGTLDVENSTGNATFCLNGNCSNNNNLSQNGYQVLPSGLIMEWGSVTLNLAGISNNIQEGWAGGGGGAAGDLNSPVFFPKPFPNALFSIVITPQDVSGYGCQETAWYSGHDLKQFWPAVGTNVAGCTPTNNTMTATWIAIGD